MKKQTLWAARGLCLILLPAACGGGGGGAPAAPSQESASLGTVDPALVGVWSGALEGTFGPSDLGMQLNGDGTTLFGGSQGRYCQANGNWGVAGGQFTARGSDCTGTRVTMVAPASSAHTKMTGTWSTNSGGTGTFSVTKQ